LSKSNKYFLLFPEILLCANVSATKDQEYLLLLQSISRFYRESEIGPQSAFYSLVQCVGTKKSPRLFIVSHGDYTNSVAPSALGVTVTVDADAWSLLQ